MPPRTTRNAFVHPFQVWSDLAWKTGEMLMASAQVIGHRTGRIATAGANPSARDRKEFIRMGQEKLDAAAESAQALTVRMISMHQQIGLLALQHWIAAAGGIMALATSRTIAQSSRRQAQFMRDAMKNSATAASHLSGSIGHVAQHGLKPIHSRATGNARRLLKIKN